MRSASSSGHSRAIHHKIIVWDGNKPKSKTQAKSAHILAPDFAVNLDQTVSEYGRSQTSKPAIAPLGNWKSSHAHHSGKMGPRWIR
jgi:hypothetical protein